jgi:hypothetical protein
MRAAQPLLFPLHRFLVVIERPPQQLVLLLLPLPSFLEDEGKGLDEGTEMGMPDGTWVSSARATPVFEEVAANWNVLVGGKKFLLPTIWRPHPDEQCFAYFIA